MRDYKARHAGHVLGELSVRPVAREADVVQPIKEDGGIPVNVSGLCGHAAYDIVSLVALSRIYGSVALPDVDVLQHSQPSHYLAICVDDFKELLNRVASTFKTRKALADALDIDPSRLSRAMNTGDFPFNIENCLRLAKVSGEPPSEVLRAADNGDIAELIESLYGPERRVNDPVVLDLLEQWPTFTLTEKNYVRSNVELVLRARRAPDDAVARKADRLRDDRSTAARKRGR